MLACDADRGAGVDSAATPDAAYASAADDAPPPAGDDMETMLLPLG